MNKLAETLEAQGRRQSWLAEQIGVTPATIRNWIIGQTAPTVEQAQTISWLLDVPLDDIFPNNRGNG